MSNVRLLAKIEHFENENFESENMVYIFDNDYINNENLIYELYHIKNKCDICNKSINRKTTFIILYDNKMLQVGCGCLKKLMPLYEKYNKNNMVFIDNHYCINRYINVKTFLNYYYQEVENKGFKKNKTILNVINNLNKIKIDSNVKNNVDNIINVIVHADNLNSFQQNIKVMLNRGYIDLKKDINIFQYVLTVYEQIKERDLKNNNSFFLGKENDKINFTIKDILSVYDNDYVINHYISTEQKTYTLIDDDNNILRINTKKDIKSYIGCQCVATVKKHFNLRNGYKCTQIKLIKKIA